MSPKARKRGAFVLLALSVIGWPVSALTFAASEPPSILGLSWLAIAITALDIVLTTDVRTTQDDEGESS